MKGCSDLEVDVNGQEIFMVDKKILASFSGKLSRLFSKVSGTKKSLKVIFHEFPGGPEGFELVARFCYNNGRIEMTPSNVVLLNCAAQFMEMDGKGSAATNLLHQTDKSFEDISFWSWPDLLVALKQCQVYVPSTSTSSSFMLQKILDCLVQRLLFPGLAIPYTPSSEMSSSRWSYDTRSSTGSTKVSCSQTTWWFDDLLFLNIDLVDTVIRRLISFKLDHSTISKFLLHYRKSRFLDARPNEKRLVTEAVIDLLSLLDKNSVSCKGLFDILRVASGLKIGKLHINKLEGLIGLKLDQATVDYLLVPSPPGKGYTYDVNLVLRLVRSFLERVNDCASISPLKKVSCLVDSYIAEVAPDSHLSPSKFAALLTLLPDSARDSHDMMYQAIDMYFEAHAGLCEVKRIAVCSRLNYEKLSPSTLEDLCQNSKFPSRSVVKALVAQQMKLKSSIQEAYDIKTLDEKVGEEQIPDYVKKLYFSSDADKYRAHLQGMQWKVMELEKFCRLLQTHMANIVKTTARSSTQSFARSLPKLCSSYS